MNDMQKIPLNQLCAWQGNVRKTPNKGFIDELAASIKAHGLQQNLIVRKEGRKFAVIAGGQRLKALLQLAKAGEIKSGHLVPCRIADKDSDPSELSLAENVMRDDMHPADQFEAFRDLADKGIPTTDIAVRFGKTETHVLKLLKLARVSPAVVKAYREARLTLEEVMAFAVSDAHAAQEAVLEHLRENDSPRSIREALTENETAASDRRVKFVTLKAYEKAGGATRRDLFAEGEDSFFILDAALLDRLAADKLAKAAKAIEAEGWKWVEAHPAFTYEQKSQFRRVYAEPAPLAAKLAKEVATLEAEYAALQCEWEEAGEDAEQPERMGEISERLDAIGESRELVFTPEQLALAGAVVTIGNDGKAEILRGLVRPEDAKQESQKAKKQSAAAIGEADGENTETPQAGYSAALTESLTAQKSAALAAELLQRPDIALAAVVHALACNVLLDNHAGDIALQITASKQSLHRVEGSKALAQVEASREKWGSTIPATGESLRAWCLEQDKDVLLDLLAFCAASTVNAVQGKGDRLESARLEAADRLAAALNLDMKPWFTPDAENYFSRISKPQILEALTEARANPTAPAWAKLKKAELAALAERETADKGWLPPLLRTAAA